MIKAFCSLLLIVVISVGSVFAQTTKLPKFKKSESYSSVRVKMIKAGWKPFHADDADDCSDGDTRCEGRPEMASCAGTGMANCKFLWKRKGKTAAIFTVGEGASYQSYGFE